MGRFICSSTKMTQFHYSHLCYAKRLALLTLAVIWGCCMVHHGTAEPGLGLYQLEGGELIRLHTSDGLTASLKPFARSRAAQLSRISFVFFRDAR